MAPRRDEMIVTAALDNIRHSFAIDLEIENQIPPKVWSSQDNKASTWLSGRAAHRDRRHQNQNEENSAKVAG